MAVLFDNDALEYKYKDMTLFTLGEKIINPILAAKMVLRQYQDNYALVPPRNTSLQVMWFYQRHRRFAHRTFVIINHPTPPELRTIHTWNISHLEDALDTAQGCYIQTKDSLNLALTG